MKARHEWGDPRRTLWHCSDRPQVVSAAIGVITLPLDLAVSALVVVGAVAVGAVAVVGAGVAVVGGTKRYFH